MVSTEICLVFFGGVSTNTKGEKRGRATTTHIYIYIYVTTLFRCILFLVFICFSLRPGFSVSDVFISLFNCVLAALFHLFASVYCFLVPNFLLCFVMLF